VLPDTSDPVELMRPYHRLIPLAADLSGVPEENLLYRAIQIMSDLRPADQWSAAAEKRTRNNLDAISLNLPFRRPRVEAARFAILRLFSELIDGRALEDDSIELLERVLRLYDPDFVLAHPARRPDDVGPVSGLSKYGEAPENWLDSFDEANVAIIRTTVNGGIVLGETTKLRRLGWKLPGEIRWSGMLRSSRAMTKRVAEDMNVFNTVFDRYAREYIGVPWNSASEALIVRSEGKWLDSPSHGWLALDPRVGAELGWTLAPEGWFRWLDSSESVAVESIWWRDGTLGFGPPHPDDEVGAGWRVVATRLGWDTIRERFGELVRGICIERSLYHDKRKTIRNWTNIEPAALI
jgi:hypothetical protein